MSRATVSVWMIQKRSALLPRLLGHDHPCPGSSGAGPARQTGPSRPAAGPRAASGPASPSPCRPATQPRDPVAAQGTAAGTRPRNAEWDRELLTEAKVTEVAAAVRGVEQGRPRALHHFLVTPAPPVRLRLAPPPSPRRPGRRSRPGRRPHPADEPLLTALVAATDTNSASVSQRVANQLGRTAPEDTQAARSQWQTDALHLQQLYR